jgi:hypothetical protein
MTKIVTLLGLVIGASLYAAALRQTSVPAHELASRPVSVTDDGFTSSQTCHACHPSQYDTWRTSFHRTMTQVASPETVRSDFNNTMVPAVHGRAMQLERRGRELWAEFDDPDWTARDGRSPQRIRRQVVMTTGSHNQEVYWYETDRGRELGQLPGTYIIAEQRWMPRSMVFLAPPVGWPESTTGRWNGICINCHTTHGKPRLAAAPASASSRPVQPDTTVAEFGIACEACHGPGDRHARTNQNIVRRYWSHLTGRRDPTTVQPAMLDAKSSSQVCGQCHGVWLFNDTEAKVNDERGPRYRPGDDIMSTRILARGTHPDEPVVRRRLAEYPEFLAALFWSDGMVRVSGREYNGLVESPCYAKATEPRRTMSCFSCHTMHPASDDPRSEAEWADTHQVAAGRSGDDACLQCHEKFRASPAAHTKHGPGSTGSACYNCHMPYTSYGLLKALRSHTISSPTVAESVQTGRPNACNLCHLDKPLGWTATKLEQWYGTPKIDLSEDDQTIAASLVWMLKGDAGQRALMAWAMGWQPAQQASGADWIPAFLSGLFDDPYDAVRFIAYRSMRSQPGFAAFEGDFVAAPAQRRRDIERIVNAWRQAQAGRRRRNDPALLLTPDGSFNLAAVTRLLAQQDRRPVRLNE